jgi:oxygen-independent coproporphyrinogen-3 oxidase
LNTTACEVDVLRKYAGRGPRYTSYPTAPNFSPGFGAREYAKALGESTAAGRPLSLYFHLPFCAELCYFCACSTVHTKKRDQVEPYLGLLERELDTVCTLLGPKRPVTQVHWGGGTPTYLTPSEIKRLMRATRKRFDLEPDAEVSIEIDPRTATPEHLDALAEAGFNRASLGIQDLDPLVQRAINRVQTIEQIASVVTGLRRRGIASISFDLIYGLPHQTRASFARTMGAVLALDPDRIALFNFAYVPWLKPHQRAIPEDALPESETRLAIFSDAWWTLAQVGYRALGLDHFAKPTDDLCRAQDQGTLHRNFQGYSTRSGADLIGFGVTAIGQVGDSYAQNAKSLDAYQAAIENGIPATERGLRLSSDDRVRSAVIMELITHFRLDRSAIEERFGIEFSSYFATEAEELERFFEDGLLELDEGELRVTDRGRFAIRTICMAFDAYLPKNLASGQRFSRAL